ncbi:Nn.00g108930.m01.CDS01 [Neocucurbitaria sp. VM-36]
MTSPKEEQSSYDTHNAGRRSQAPSASEVPSSSARATDNPSPAVAAAAPASRTFFDPWNSSSTGHQRAENRLAGSTSWRVSRNLKLGEQYRGGLTGGGKRVADTVGAGSEDFGKDGRKANGGWEKGAKGLRTGGQKSLAEVWGATKAGKHMSKGKDTDKVDEVESEQILSRSDHSDGHLGYDHGMSLPHYAPEGRFSTRSASSDMLRSNWLAESISDLHGDLHRLPLNSPEKQIFAGLCFYVNGSTAPLVSDHKLKHMLAAHGARHSIALGRRSVTHVILATANTHGGAGGGLAASKIHKEIARTGGKAVKFVTAEWVLESIKANCRLPESRFSPLKLAPKTQGSAIDMLGRKRELG